MILFIGFLVYWTADTSDVFRIICYRMGDLNFANNPLENSCTDDLTYYVKRFKKQRLIYLNIVLLYCYFSKCAKC